MVTVKRRPESVTDEQLTKRVDTVLHKTAGVKRVVNDLEIKLGGE